MKCTVSIENGVICTLVSGKFTAFCTNVTGESAKQLQQSALHSNELKISMSQAHIIGKQKRNFHLNWALLYSSELH